MSENALEFAGHTLSRASLDCCVKCTICETQCPVLEATPLFPGPKYVGPQAERFRNGASVDASVDLCSMCGTCTLVCPQGVKIAELNTQAIAVAKADHMPLRDRLISNTQLMGAAMHPVAPVANAALQVKPLRVAIEKTVGIHRDAPMPHAPTQSLRGWLRRRDEPVAPAAGSRGPVIFFHGCAGSNFEVDASKKAIEVLEFLGYTVTVPKQGCCGQAAKSNGLFESAAKQTLQLCDQLIAAGAQLGEDGDEIPIVGVAGSCAGMMKHEAREVMGITDERLVNVSSRMREFTEFVAELLDSGDFPTELLRPMPDTVLPYHQSCQVKSQYIGQPAIRVMEAIPGVTVKESGRACCGMAGTYGLKKEKYDIAQAMGKPLFDFIQDENPAIAVCEAEPCRWHIRKGSGAKAVHPSQVLHHAFGLSDDLFDRNVIS
ncbi:anaerobic glycerol-3-phosphate dehydrogenase subunit C [Nanchangia anserum]|uniref:Anaerobic glycerol-3-phosphate dehydrogenase subunit C n=1 Tax=Nanchangia anserum TaxID=2692125 RepID=A0A8I0GDI5_9ACTO|nr:anaerobic glycerol-3-phosphate dehydrogenase subunit C [Nanchangia anserum]MBD3690160.1 anaerobic glycerol-3-phosphate dehydrogenase subunit C [Nanchangia anserum]